MMMLESDMSEDWDTPSPAIRHFEERKSVLRMKFEQLVEQESDKEYHVRLNMIRQIVLMEGIPPQSHEELRQENIDHMCSLRGKIWKLLLGVRNVDGEKYLHSVQQGPSRLSEKISNDTKRTFQHDTLFGKIVNEAKLIRLLNAFVNYTTENNIANVDYVQGMNVIAGMFLYVMPEPDAFECYCSLVLEHLPLYYSNNMKGVYRGVELLTLCLKELDPELHDYLLKHNYQPQFLMHTIVSLGAATPPLSEAMYIWDYLFAFGLHLAPLVPIAQLVNMRDSLLKNPSPCACFRSLPQLEAKPIESILNLFVKELSGPLWDLLIRHPYDSNWKIESAHTPPKRRQ